MTESRHPTEQEQAEITRMLVDPAMRDGLLMPRIPRVQQLHGGEAPKDLGRFWAGVRDRTDWERVRAEVPESRFPILHAMRWIRIVSRQVWALNATMYALRWKGWRVRWEELVSGTEVEPFRKNPLWELGHAAMVWQEALNSVRAVLDPAEEQVPDLRWRLIPIPGRVWQNRSSLRRVVFRSGLDRISGRPSLPPGWVYVLSGLTQEEKSHRDLDHGPFARLTRLQDDEGRLAFHGGENGERIRGRPFSVWGMRKEVEMEKRREEIEAQFQHLDLFGGPIEVPWQSLMGPLPVEIPGIDEKRPGSLRVKRERRVKECSERRSPKPRCQCESCKELIKKRNLYYRSKGKRTGKEVSQ